MSFKVAISDVLVWNEALSLLPSEPVTNIAEQSTEARECRRHYKSIVAEMLEMHHWGLATKRVALAPVLNDRPAEWLFAYAKPADLAYPVHMIPVNGNVYMGWTYRDNGYWSIGGRQLMKQVGGTIYSVLDAAVIEYTSFAITEADFTSLFKRAVVLELAARTCYAITKNASRQADLAKLSDGYQQRVIANDLNRDQPTYGDGLTESALVRFGGGSYGLGGGYALDPVANPANTGY